MRINEIIGNPTWFINGRHIAGPAQNDADASACVKALERINDDTLEILEPEEFYWEWRLCMVPFEAINPQQVHVDRPEAPWLDTDRMTSVRSANAVLPPSIYKLLPDGQVEIMDGSHRYSLAIERRSKLVHALVGKPGILVDEAKKYPGGTTPGSGKDFRAKPGGPKSGKIPGPKLVGSGKPMKVQKGFIGSG